jgi:Hydrolase of X-linked nucleoside diphosphate N terminal
MPDILGFLERFQAIARLGLSYANNPYDQARCREILELTTQMHALTLEFPNAKQQSTLSQQQAREIWKNRKAV